jgi:hypothetical protein
MQSSKWARWDWGKEGLGRWHAVVATGEGQTPDGTPLGQVAKLACGRVRKAPAVTAGRPGTEKCCDSCRKLDDLRTQMHDRKVDSTESLSTVTLPPLSVSPEAVTATGGAPVAPADMVCACGCDKSAAAVAYRLALAEWQGAERARRSAEFEAYVASKAVAS